MKMKELFKYIIISLFLSVSGFSQYWEKVTSIPFPYNTNYWLDVQFLKSNENYGWISGFGGMVLRTTDGGGTWQGTTIPQADQLESICFTSTLVGYTSGPTKVFKSINGGVSFFDITPLNALEIWGNFFIDDNNGVVVGGGCANNVQHFWRTTNGGASWNEFLGSEPISGLTHVILLSPNGLGYASSSGRIWRSTDGGFTWNIFSVTGTNLWQESLDVINNSIIVPFSGNLCSGGGSTGGMRFSTNLGASWNLYTTGQPMFGTKLIDEQTAWACGYKAALYFTTNGGLNWDLKNCGIQNNDELDDLYFFNANSGYAVGENVYKLVPPVTNYSKNQMIFGLTCIPDIKYDTIKVFNYSFFSSSYTASLTSGAGADYQIISPGSNFSLGPCDSINVIVKFSPLSTGMKNANLRIIDNGVNYTDFPINGSGLNSTASTKITDITVNKIQCNSKLDTLINWTCDNDLEEILSISLVTGSTNITMNSTMPLKIGTGGCQTYFTVSPKDTGWIETKFKAVLFPCLKEIIITIRAYGVSPIITSDRARSIFNFCTSDQLDTLPIANNGNTDLLIGFAYFLNPQFSIVGFTSGKNFPVTISKGKRDSLIIKFLPGKTGKYNSILKIVNNDSTKVFGDKNPFNVDYIGEYYDSKLIQRDSIIDFGEICIGDSNQISTKILNNGNLKSYLRNSSNKANIEVYSKPNNFPAPILPNDSISVIFKYKPNKVGVFRDSIKLFSDECNQMINYILIGKGISADVFSYPAGITSVLQTNIIKKEIISLKSLSDFDLKLVKVTLSPINSLVTFSYNLPNGSNLKANDSLPIEINLSALKDTALSFNICFELEGKCNTEYCMPLKIISLSNWTEINKDTLNFGLFKCSDDSLSMDVIISNKGMQNDTINKIEISPLNSNFKLNSNINLPYYLKPNEDLKISIKFKAINLGKFSDSLLIETQNFKSKPFKVYLFADYKQSKILFDVNGIDFGTKEFCQTDTIIEFKFYNVGNIQDSIEIIRKAPLKEINLIDNYSFVVPANDSVTIRFKLSPALFTKAGFNSETVTFNEKNCKGGSDFSVHYELIQPKINVNPKDLKFGSLWAGDSLQLSYEIENISNYNISVYDFKLEPYYKNYKISQALPFNMTKGEKRKIDVKFNSISEGKFNSTLKIYYNSLCYDSTEIKLSAETPKEIYKINIITGDYTIPAGNEFTIETILKDSVYKLLPDEINFSFTYDKYLFDPTKLFIRSNKILTEVPFSNYGGEIRFNLTGNIAKDLFKNKDTIIFIKGIALVSIPFNTPLVFSKIDVKNYNNLEIIKKDGSLTVSDFCIKTGESRVQFLPILKINKIEELNENYSIEIESDINLDSKIRIFNSLGNECKSQLLNIIKGSNKYNLDLQNLSNGSYYLQIQNDYKPLFYNIIKLK
jgi:photosystem II stability/assembly factor-like uncharacterized protein